MRMNVVRSRRSARYRMALLTMVVIAFGAITTIATATEIGLR